MSKTMGIGFIVGSLREGSANRTLAHAMMDLCGTFAKTTMIEIRDLAYYNPDLEQDPPAEWIKFRDGVAQSGCILIVTPEYNRSVPSALKNALDVGGSPVLGNVWNNKCVGLSSISRGKFAEWNSNDHLAQSLQFLNALIFPDRSMRFGSPETVFSDEGALTDQETKKVVQRFLQNFLTWAQNQTSA